MKQLIDPIAKSTRFHSLLNYFASLPTRSALREIAEEKAWYIYGLLNLSVGG